MFVARAFLALTFLSVLAFGSIACHADDEPSKDQSTRLIEPTGMMDTTLTKFIERLGQCDVLFLGEEHNSDACHETQLEFIKALFDSGRGIAISMEMFERDVQGVVDDYLSGRIDEVEFKKHSNPWKNYDQHYRPIIEFAKQNNIPVIAGNVPRSLASSMAKGAEQSSDSPLRARHTTAPQDQYYQRFLNIMKGHVGTDNGQAMENAYRSQCLKDDTMAESIVDFLETHPHRQPLVVHLCGNFHSDYGYGTAMRVLLRRPLMNIAVFTMRRVDDLKEIPEDVDRNLADVVLLVQKKPKPEK